MRGDRRKTKNKPRYIKQKIRFWTWCEETLKTRDIEEVYFEQIFNVERNRARTGFDETGSGNYGKNDNLKFLS